MDQKIISSGFETKSVRMEALWMVSFPAPEEDVDRIMNAVTRVVPLTMGHYDNCAFQSAAGIERYRPREGAAAGREDEVRKRPGVVEITFQMPRDQGALNQVIEAIFATHSYQEPAIVVQEIIASRSKGGDEDNPNRWWNKGGDWKKKE